MAKSFKNELLAHSKSKRAKKLIAVRLPEDLFKEIEKLAKESDQSVSAVIIHALRYTLKKQA